MIAVKELIKARPAEAYVGCAVVRPWKDLPLIKGELEIEGELITTSKPRAVDFIVNSRSCAKLTLIDRTATRGSTAGGVNRYVLGFLGMASLSRVSNAAEAVLRVGFDDGSHFDFATVRFYQPDYSQADLRRLVPDFFIVGAMKAGTTTLYDIACQHPRVLQREPKETLFFTNAYEKGMAYYRSFFTDKLAHDPAESVIAGDATPTYMSPYHPEVAERIQQHFPAAKIILSLRDPVERAISHYHHKITHDGTETRRIEEAFGEEAIASGQSEDLLEFGNYVRCLEPWLRCHSKQNILFLNFHELTRCAEEVVRRLYAFLGLNGAEQVQVRKMLANEYARPPAHVVKRLESYYRDANASLVRLLGPEFDFNAREHVTM